MQALWILIPWRVGSGHWTATKLLGLLTLKPKGYVADISFGTAPRNGADGRSRSYRTVPESLYVESFARCMRKAGGTVDQLPPAVSAISVDGLFVKVRHELTLVSLFTKLRFWRCLKPSTTDESTGMDQLRLTFQKGTIRIARDAGDLLELKNILVD